MSMRRHLTNLTASLSFALAANISGAGAQLPPVGIIDFYGLRKITPAQVREALGIAVGDSITSLALFQVPGRLAEIPGVSSASIDPVCCEDGKTMLYVGLAEDGAPALEGPLLGAVRRKPEFGEHEAHEPGVRTKRIVMEDHRALGFGRRGDSKGRYR